MTNCASCHGLESSSVSNNFGPALGMIYNKKMGSDPEYSGYSDTLVASNRFWSARNLFRFMYNPQQLMRGITCPVSKEGGLKSEQDRADLIQFLRQFTHELEKNIKIKEVKSKGYSGYQTDLYVKEVAPDSIEFKSNRK